MKFKNPIVKTKGLSIKEFRAMQKKHKKYGGIPSIAQDIVNEYFQYYYKEDEFYYFIYIRALLLWLDIMNWLTSIRTSTKKEGCINSQKKKLNISFAFKYKNKNYNKVINDIKNKIYKKWKQNCLYDYNIYNEKGILGKKRKYYNYMLKVLQIRFPEYKLNQENDFKQMIKQKEIIK